MSEPQKTQDRIKEQSVRFLTNLLNTEGDINQDLRGDICDYISILGLSRFSQKITDEELVKGIKEVCQNESMINKFQNWIHIKILEDQKNKQEAEKELKKTKVPEIYKAKQEPVEKKQKEKKQEKPIERPRREDKPTKNQQKDSKQKDKPSIFDRIKDEQPQPKKKMRTERPERTQGNEGKMEEEEVDLTKQKTKCKHFPFCKKENCPFFHPTEKCTYFPRCKYGQACMKMHEPCRFLENCNRPDCFYDHPVRSLENNFATEFLKILMGGQQQSFKRPFRRPKPQTQPQGELNKQGGIQPEQPPQE